MPKRRFGDHSEYDGGGVMPNTVHPMGTDALTASDQLRLQSITGQELDSQAPVDPYFWYGNTRPDPTQERQDAQVRRQRERMLEREEKNRYKESHI